MEVKLYVGNLPYLTSDEDLRALFAQAGTVAAAAVIKDRETGTSTGFGFVTMTTRAAAESAVQLLNNYALGEHSLKVSMARPRTNHIRGYRR